jgi:hypothetical protein
LSNKECRTTDSEQQAIDPKRICKYCGWIMDIEYAYARGKLNEQQSITYETKSKIYPSKKAR